MKITAILLLCIFLFAGCSKDRNSADNTSGGVKLYRVMSQGKLGQEYAYNTAGYVTRQTFYFSPDKKSSETIYLYDTGNRLIKTESFIDVSSSTSTQQLIHSYTEYKYGTDGKLSEERTYTKNGALSELRSVITPTYDADGRIVSRVQLVDSKPVNLYTYKYNARGNITEQESYKYDGNIRTLGFRMTYEHDNKNNPYINLGVLPFSVNRNNITRATTTNYNITPGNPVVTTSETIYKKYNSHQLPLEVVEHGTVTFTYEYR